MNLAFEINKDEWTDNFKFLINEYPNQAQIALGFGALALWQDILTEAPTPHILTGYTQGSISVHVGGVLKNPDDVSQGSSLATEPMPPIPRKITQEKLEAIVAVNSPYAARLHELPPTSLGPRSKLDGSVGPKFVEAKLSKNGEKYIRLIANKLRDLIGKLKK